MARIIEKIIEYYQVNQTSASLFIISLFTFIVSLLLMNTMANISSFWSIDLNESEPLPDFAFEWLRIHEINYIVEMCMNFLIVFTLVSILTKRDAIKIYFRFFICASICYFLRMSLVSMTNLPSPNERCIKITEKHLTHFGYNRCGDVMFSGHTLITTICVLTWTSHDLMRNQWLSRVMCYFVWTVATIVYISIVVARNHYTIDVLLSIYITVGIWALYGNLWSSFFKNENVCKSMIIREHDEN